MGLREVKKERTRRAIEDAAIALFAERGYQATTVADIARAADIAPRTFFAYYRSKEDVLFGDADQMFDELEAHLHERPSGESTFDGLRRWIDEVMTDELHAHDERERVVRDLVAANESLQARERRLMGRFEDLLATAVAALWCMRDGDDGRPADHDQALDQLDEALAFLRAGTAALVGAAK